MPMFGDALIQKEGSNFDNVFYVDKGRKNGPNNTISGPSLARLETPFKWPNIEYRRGSFVIFQGCIWIFEHSWYVRHQSTLLSQW